MIIKEETFYTQEKKLLFLHGYLADKRCFSYQIPFFSRFFDVYAFDLKGFGENKGMEYPYSLDDYVSSVKEYMYKNSLYSPSVIAHSFGGRIAIKLASESKTAFSKIVLTGSAGLKPKKTIKKVVKKTTFDILKRFVDKEKLSFFYSKDFNGLDDVMKKSFIKIVNEYLDGRLKDIENETLIIYGSKDKETPVYMAKRLKEGIVNSSLSIYDKAGHFPFIDCPIRFNMEVKEFLLSK